MVMRKEVFAGRSTLKRIFKDFFSKMIEESKDSRSFLSFGKQREQGEPLSPKILLFTGENGLGKSSALKQCIKIAQDAGSESKKSVKIVSLDMEEWYQRKGRLPVTPKEFMSILFEVVSEKEIGLAQYFTRYQDLAGKIDKLAETEENVTIDEWARELFLEPVSFEDADLHKSCEQWVRKKFSKQEFDLLEKADIRSTELLANGFSEASSDCSIIFSIDSIELLNIDIEAWFRLQFLCRLYEQKNRTLTIISGSNNFARGFRSSFPEDMCFTFNFRDITLSTFDVSHISQKLFLNLADEDIKKVEAYSAGIPVIVQDIADYIEKKKSLGDVIRDAQSELMDIDTLTGEVIQRLVSINENVTARDRIFHLCMSNQFTPALLAKLWNISFSDINGAINELSESFSFIKNKRVHAIVRSCIRTFLLQESVLGSDSVFNEFFNTFSSICSEYYDDQLLQLCLAIPSLEKRYKDERYCNILTGKFTTMFWTSPDEAFSALPGYYLEMIHFNKKCAMDLLWQIEEFRPVLSTAYQDTLDMMEQGIYLNTPSMFRNRAPVDNKENVIIEYLTNCSSSFSDERKALLNHIAGRLAFRMNQFEGALQYFKKALSHVEVVDNIRLFLFEDFLMLGYAFFSDSNPQSAVEAFSHAVRVRPDSFLPWFDMGNAYICMEQFDKAVESLNKAVAINPDYQEAWHSLGTCNNRLGNHRDAVVSFAKAIEKGPQSAELWFEIANSYQSLDQHEDAVKSYGKVVSIDPSNAVAWYLMGKSNSALSISQEAVLSYRKAIEIRNDYFEALEALGLEYFMMKQYADAAQTLEKAAELQPENAQLLYNVSHAWFKADKYENSIKTGLKAVECNPLHADAYFIIGKSHTAMSSFQDALAAFKKSAEIEPKNAETWDEIGNSYYAQTLYPDAINAFHKAIEVEPTHKGTWHSIGLAHKIQEQFTLAVEAFSKAVEIEPENTESWFQKGRVHMTLEQYDRAIEAFTKTTELTPDSHDAWYRKGLSFAKKQTHDKAIDSFVKAAELWRSDPDIWYNLGLSYAALHYHESAVQSFKEATALAPSRYELYHNLGISLKELTSFEDAITAFNKALEVLPDATGSLSGVAECYYQLGKYTEAKTGFGKVAEAEPENTDNLYFLALTCHALGEFQDAIHYYTAITNQKPEFTEAWFNMAVAYHALGDYPRAIEVYVQIVDREQDHGAAWYNLGTAYHAINQLENAIISYREASRISPVKVDIWFQMGIALHTMQQYGEAIQAYRKVVNIVPSHVDAWLNLGTAYLVWHNFEDASASFKKVLEFQHDHFGALSNLTISLFESAEYKNAIEAAEKAIALKPDESWINAYLVSSYAMVGNLALAGERLETLKSFDANGQDLEQTRQILKKAITNKPGTAEAESFLKKLDELQSVKEPETAPVKSE
jgi:tetratricopeptide (TPR) repeat protein